jgi:hypothetical protein
MSSSRLSFTARYVRLAVAGLLVGCLLVLAAGVVMFVAAMRSMSANRQQVSEPLDNESLQLLGAGRKHWPSLEKPRDHQVFGITSEQMNSLIETLHPIRSVRVGELPPNAVDYMLGFQPGMDPVVFYVHLVDDHLVYSERKYLYEGGNAKAFKQAVDTIMATNPGKPGMIDDSLTEKRGEKSLRK